MGEIKRSVEEMIVVVRGGGDLATGVIQKLYHAGFKVVVLETAIPLAIRRTVSLCSAVFSGEYQVEDMTAVLISSPLECGNVWEKNQIPVLVDPKADILAHLEVSVVVDAILAKRNLGTILEMAPIVVALGPGFTAKVDADAVIETMRGHSLGYIYYKGSALANTGIPGELGGKSGERVVHSPATGDVKHLKKIGDVVKKGELLFYVGETPVNSPLDGVLRGLISNELKIPQGLKCADVDPRPVEEVDYQTISDKARALGGAVLDAVFSLARNKKIL